jgi:RNA-directed DNA polymerase
LLSNLYLNEVDKMLERAKEVTRQGPWMKVEYARFAHDLVILVDGHSRQAWLRKAVEKRLREELAKLQVEVNEEKSRRVDLQQGECFAYIRDWVEKKIRSHLARARQRQGFGWKRWHQWLYGTLGLYQEYLVAYQPRSEAAAPS